MELKKTHSRFGGAKKFERALDENCAVDCDCDLGAGVCCEGVALKCIPS